MAVNKRVLIGILLAAGAAYAGCAPRQTWKEERAAEVVETLSFNVAKGSGELRLWFPKPPVTAAQSVVLEEVRAPWPHSLTRETEFGNETVHFRARRPEPGPVSIELRYRVQRRLQGTYREEAPPGELYLKPRGLLVPDAEIRAMAAAATAGLTTTMDKARALYRHVLGYMTYDKSGTGWGRGDPVYACRVAKGNCTDFHALFMSLAMASGIPSRFRMGYLLPEAERGETAGYHCWVEFYAEGYGWVPADISAAWHNPRLARRYFGLLDPDRVLVSTGREIRLSPPQSGRPLNFLDRPYAETDGRELYGMKLTRKYRTLRPT